MPSPSPLLFSPPVVFLPAGVAAGIRQATCRAAPEEACGLLFGDREDGVRRVRRASVAENVAEDRIRHFEIDPRHLFDAHRAARAGGETILGCWHSHPSGPSLPSAADRAGIGDRTWVWLIVGEGGMAAHAVAGSDFVRAILAVGPTWH